MTGLRPEPAVRSRAPLVGRAEELARLEAALDRLRDGTGGVFLLHGEPGIGKTRLARETAARAANAGTQVLEGRGYPLQAGLAYAPLVEALGRALRSRDPLRRAPLLRGLPELGRLFSGLDLRPPEPGDPAMDRLRLFEAVARLVERLCGEAPLLLIVDDLQWADPASWELLLYLLNALQEARLLVLATYRSEPVDEAGGLRALLTSLRRLENVDELYLRPLPQSAAAALIAALLGGAPSAELRSTLERRARGTPLFIIELIGALRDRGQLLPLDGGWTVGEDAERLLSPGIRDLMLARLERFDGDARAVLDLLVVAAPDASYRLLRQMVTLSEETLVEALRRLRGAGLIVEQPLLGDVQFSFTHPLIPEAVYAELPEIVRRRAHARLAAALQAAGSDAERLARHYVAAGTEANQDAALDAVLVAGERSRQRYACSEAARYFEAALASLREGRRPELLAIVLERLGEAWRQIGRHGEAVAVLTEALGLPGIADDPLAVGRLRRELALAEWERGRYTEAAGQVEAGLTVMAGSAAEEELARLLQVRLTIPRPARRSARAAGSPRAARPR